MPQNTNDINQMLVSRIDEFAHSLQVERNASAHTIRNYTVDLQDFARWAERSHIDPLHPTHRQLRRYLANLDAAQYARTTINRRLSSLRSFYRWQIQVGYSDVNPAEALASLKRDKTLPHRIRPDEMTRILHVWGPTDNEGNARKQTPVMMRNQALLEMLYACGARISEASQLIVSNVDFSQMQIRLLGKGNKERIVPIHALALQSMRTYWQDGRDQLAKQGSSPYFFLSTHGNQWSSDAMRKLFHETLVRAGVDDIYTPHDMRHTFASDVLEGGADLRSVQEMLGHSSLSTTQLYTHLNVSTMLDTHHQAHPRG